MNLQVLELGLDYIYYILAAIVDLKLGTSASSCGIPKLGLAETFVSMQECHCVDSEQFGLKGGVRS